MFNKDKLLTLDFRCADFTVHRGDTIIFQEWNPKTGQYTGRKYSKVVKQVIKCESPTRYWALKQLEKYGLYLFEWEK